MENKKIQLLEKRIQELNSQINTIVNNPDSEEGKKIIGVYKKEIVKDTKEIKVGEGLLSQLRQKAKDYSDQLDFNTLKSMFEEAKPKEMVIHMGQETYDKYRDMWNLALQPTVTTTASSYGDVFGEDTF